MFAFIISVLVLAIQFRPYLAIPRYVAGVFKLLGPKPFVSVCGIIFVFVCSAARDNPDTVVHAVAKLLNLTDDRATFLRNQLLTVLPYFSKWIVFMLVPAIWYVTEPSKLQVLSK